MVQRSICKRNAVTQRRIKPVSNDVLRLRVQRVIRENQLYRQTYHNLVAMLPSKGSSTEVMGKKESQKSTEKLRKRIHRLQQRLNDSEKELETIHQQQQLLQFQQTLLRKQLTSNHLLPVICTQHAFLNSFQQHEVEDLKSLFGESATIHIDSLNNKISIFLSTKLEIPTILHQSIFRRYLSFIDPNRVDRPKQEVNVKKSCSLQ